jgi:hypothetical protein
MLNQKGLEMPIQIVITLFVVLAVGTLVILFSQNVLTSTEQKLDAVGKEEISANNTLVEVTGISSDKVLQLAENCLTNNQGKTLESVVCFTIDSDTDITGDIAVENVNPQVIVDFGGETNIKYLIVKWNALEGIVEVKS